jgi:hypothetical protein
MGLSKVACGVKSWMEGGGTVRVYDPVVVVAWDCWHTGRTWEFGRRGHLYQSCCHRRLVPPAPARGTAIYIIN